MTRSTIVKIVAAVVIGAALGALMGSTNQCSTGACPLTSTPIRGAIYGAVMGLLAGFSFSS